MVEQHRRNVCALAVHELRPVHHRGVVAEIAPQRLAEKPLRRPLHLVRVVVEVGNQPVRAPEQRHVRAEPRLLEAEERAVTLQPLILHQQRLAVEVRHGHRFLEINRHARAFHQGVNEHRGAAAPVLEHVAAVIHLEEELLFVKRRSVLQPVPRAPGRHLLHEPLRVKRRDHFEVILAHAAAERAVSGLAREQRQQPPQVITLARLKLLPEPWRPGDGGPIRALMVGDRQLERGAEVLRETARVFLIDQV